MRFIFKASPFFFISLLCLVLVRPDPSFSDVKVFHSASIRYPISSPYYPIVLTGGDLPSLLTISIGRISMMALHGDVLEPIPFQIDRRDKSGIFQIPVKKKDKAEEGKHPLDNNDELVFMAVDVGEKMERPPENLVFISVTELEIIDPESGARGWVYAFVFQDDAAEKSMRDYVSYNGDDDSIESDTYRIAFSRKNPFLINASYWKETDLYPGSPNITDTMKVRYRGKLFHKLKFLRTQKDSKSRIIAVKDGPVRVIRRTVSRVRILWQLRTPAIYIDVINYANAFFMDIAIQIPFRISWFFSDVVTTMTIDGNDDPSLPQFTVFSNSFTEGLVIDGKMSEEEETFNLSGDTELVVSSPLGKILVMLDVAEDFPLSRSVYLMDDRNNPDPPEERKGQFGNVGFQTVGWEKLDASVYHMVFSVYMIRDISVEKGFEILKHSPSFLNPKGS